MKIIFFGTTDFAVTSLDHLHKAGHEILCVVTTPSKLGGRGRKEVIQSAVYHFAKERQLPLLQPATLKGPKFLAKINALKADLFVVVAFRMMPEVLWSIPRHGTINLHASLLPAYRGAAPINWAIIKGEKETGVTIFFLDKKIDTGNILHQKKVIIEDEDNFGTLYSKLQVTGAEELNHCVAKISSGTIIPMEQDDEKASHAPKLDKENTHIDFNYTNFEVVNLCRGLDPYPGAWFDFDGQQMKVYKCEANNTVLKPGQWSSDYKGQLLIGCRIGSVELKEIQLEGKKRMSIKEFLNGHAQKLKLLKERN